jgi:hypothetical protein
MKLCSGKDESQLSTTEVAVHDLQIVDSDLGFSFRMASMEVREAVIVEEHDDGDPKEAADRRHASIMPMPAEAQMQTESFILALAGYARVGLPAPALSESDKAGIG